MSALLFQVSTHFGTKLYEACKHLDTDGEGSITTGQLRKLFFGDYTAPEGSDDKASAPPSPPSPLPPSQSHARQPQRRCLPILGRNRKPSRKHDRRLVRLSPQNQSSYLYSSRLRKSILVHLVVDTDSDRKEKHEPRNLLLLDSFSLTSRWRTWRSSRVGWFSPWATTTRAPGNPWTW